jgi:3-oxoacyl-[acyl-carrier protein] reductase
LPKIIVITGAGEGLGRALARRFIADGDSVVVMGRTVAKINAVAKDLGERAMAVACDVSSPDSVRTAFAAIAKRHPKIDVLINNAALYEPVLVAEATDREILEAIGTNLTGPILCIRAAIPMMERGSHIINVSSESCVMHFPFMTLYQATKAGLERLNQSLYTELEPSGIRVSMVRAGSMYDHEKPVNMDPIQWGRFHAANAAVGRDFLKNPVTPVDKVTGIFRTLIDLPPELNVEGMLLHAWAGAPRLV